MIKNNYNFTKILNYQFHYSIRVKKEKKMNAKISPYFY